LSPESSVKAEDPFALIEAACARNRSIEIHYNNRSGEFFAARSRLLGYDAHDLLLDNPQSIGKEVVFQTGQSIDAFIMIGDQIFTFRSKIIKTQCQIKLNDYIAVDGLRITRPNNVRKSQRRHDLRVSVAALDKTEAVLHGVSSENAAPLDAMVFQGVLGNLSGGGCGLILNTILCSKLKIGSSMFLGFIPPGELEQVIFQVEVRSARLVPPDEETTYVGVQFLNWPSRGYLRRTLRPLERLIAEIQRASLKKNR